MRPLRTMVTVLAIFAWLFSISHCDLEGAGIIPADNCGQVQEASTSPHSDPCDTGCKIMEESAFKLESTKAKFAVASILLKFTALETQEDPAFPLTQVEIPPRFNSNIFLYAARTSIPARAPSLIS